MTADGLSFETVVRRYADPHGRDGFEEFVHATADRVHRAAVLLSGDHHLAEDLRTATTDSSAVRQPETRQ